MKQYQCTIVESRVYLITVSSDSEDAAKQEAEHLFTHTADPSEYFDNFTDFSIEHVEVLDQKETTT